MVQTDDTENYTRDIFAWEETIYDKNLITATLSSLWWGSSDPYNALEFLYTAVFAVEGTDESSNPINYDSSSTTQDLEESSYELLLTDPVYITQLAHLQTRLTE